VKGLAALGTFVLGLVVGVSSVALHHYWWGLALGIVATATAAYALPSGWLGRVPFSVGWVASVGLLAVPLDQGGYLIAADVQGYTLLGFAAALLVGAMVTLRPLRRGGPDPAEEPS
jgi:hypothetical protein